MLSPLFLQLCRVNVGTVTFLFFFYHLHKMVGQSAQTLTYQLASENSLQKVASHPVEVQQSFIWVLFSVLFNLLEEILIFYLG